MHALLLVKLPDGAEHVPATQGMTVPINGLPCFVVTLVEDESANELAHLDLLSILAGKAPIVYGAHYADRNVGEKLEWATRIATGGYEAGFNEELIREAQAIVAAAQESGAGEFTQVTEVEVTQVGFTS